MREIPEKRSEYNEQFESVGHGMMNKLWPRLEIRKEAVAKFKPNKDVGSDHKKLI